jgi:hypothetical protein
MKTFRRVVAIRAYQNKVAWRQIRRAPQIRFLIEPEILSGGNHGTRKQKEIHVKAEAESRAHRGRLRETWRFEEGSRIAGLGDRQQIGQGRQEERIRPREKEQQGLLA